MVIILVRDVLPETLSSCGRISGMMRSKLRHPRERSDLFIAVIAAGAMFLILSALTWGVCCLWGAIGLLFVAFMVAVENSHLKNTAKPLEEDPVLDRMLKEASGKLGIDPPKAYISGSKEVNAYTRGVISPVLVLNRGLIDTMDEGEISFVMGHELGHIKLRHFAIRTILDARVRVPILVYLPLMLFRMLFLHGRLSRSMEYSADRAGLSACGSLEKAISTMIKLGTGRSVTPDQVRGAMDGSFRIDGEKGIVGRLLSSHPDLDDRVRELVRSQ